MRATTILMALAMALLAGCGGGDKAGGEGGVKTLRLGSADPKGRIASKNAERFAAEVRRRSDGKLRVEIVWQAAGDDYDRPAWDQIVAGRVRDGELELGIVPSRAWDRLGVTTLRALQAPFLITSDELVERVVRSPLAGEMLDGVAKAGVVGLALLPEELRHPVGLGRPLRAPADFQGVGLRAPLSDVSYELMRALGAKPLDLTGGPLDAAVADGRVGGAESSLSLISGTLARGTVTANVTFFPKLQTIVADREAFEALSQSEQEILRDAGAATLDPAIDAMVPAARAADEACKRGARVIAASPGSIAALEQAAQPVYDTLERDPQTRALIGGIRELKSETNAATSAVPECEPERSRAAPVAAGDDPSVLNGVYRYFVDVEALLTAGVTEEDAYKNAGLTTNTLRDGRLTSKWTTPDGKADVCVGDYTVAGNTFELELRAPCEGRLRLGWTKTRGGLRVTYVEGLPPFDTAYDELLDTLVWAGVWKRIG